MTAMLTTCGPWKLRRGPTYWGLYHPDTDRLLATVAHNKRANSDANAELIAAAPEMLAALRHLHGALRERHYGRMPEDVQQAYDSAGALLGRFVTG